MVLKTYFSGGKLGIPNPMVFNTFVELQKNELASTTLSKPIG